MQALTDWAVWQRLETGGQISRSVCTAAPDKASGSSKYKKKENPLEFRHCTNISKFLALF